MDVKTPSINAVPDEATIYVDRRITFGETPEAELQRLRDVIGQRDDITAEILVYDDPSYTGFVFPLDKIYPAWAYEEDEAIVRAGLRTARELYGETVNRQVGLSPPTASTGRARRAYPASASRRATKFTPIPSLIKSRWKMSCARPNGMRSSPQFLGGPLMPSGASG